MSRSAEEKETGGDREEGCESQHGRTDSRDDEEDRDARATTGYHLEHTPRRVAPAARRRTLVLQPQRQRVLAAPPSDLAVDEIRRARAARARPAVALSVDAR